MKDFMNYDFNIETIAVACYVAPGKGTPVHNDRPTHGLAYHPSGDRYYVFDNGKKVRAANGDILYLPKNSNYVVKTVDKGDCYAINFDISETVDLSPFSFRAKNPSAFLEQFKRAENARRTKGTGYKMKCKAELYGIILRLVNEYELGYVSKNKSDILSAAPEHIHREYTKKKLVISELSGFHDECYFSREFKKATGVSPSEF